MSVIQKATANDVPNKPPTQVIFLPILPRHYPGLSLALAI